MSEIVDVKALERNIDDALYYNFRRPLYHYTSPEGLLGILKN